MSQTVGHFVVILNYYIGPLPTIPDERPIPLVFLLKATWGQHTDVFVVEFRNANIVVHSPKYIVDQYLTISAHRGEFRLNIKVGGYWKN